MAMTMLKVRCAAKVNLCLAILHRRPDGYHALRSLMTAVSIFDELEITPSEQFQLTDASGQALDERNTVWRAANLFAKELDKPLPFAVRLYKGIPSEAGLGGGSSDGAAMLLTLRRFWKLRTPWRKLVPLAARIGADVPFFLVPTGAAIVSGIGEQLTPIRLPPLWLVLAKPAASMPTKEAFALWDAQPVSLDADPALLAEALRRKDWATVRCHAQNAFEPLVAKQVPSVIELKQRLLFAGANAAVMSGSGTTVIGIFADKLKAKQGLLAVQGHASWSALAHTVQRSIVLKGR